MTNRHIIINIGRQLGSGGHDIGRMLALDFSATYYDRELLNLAAKESGLSERFFEQNDEHKSFLRSFLHIPNALSATADYSRQSFSQDSFFQFQSDAIRKAASQGSCVFVGRCADYVLRDFDNVVNIFVTAPMSFRIGQVMAKQCIDEEAARHFIEQGESRRAAYYNYYTGKRWGAAENYDLCIDASILGLQQTEQFIAHFIRKRFEI
ncbi:MAG: cytidylate kinase-like family protein [Prevotella sp.]|nr:cytidylate kinase-like family protein [Prevotella sp.]